MSHRKQLFHVGRKGKLGYVRGFSETVHDRDVIRVQWRELSGTKTETWDNTRKSLAEARAFAEGVHERLTNRTPSTFPAIAQRELFARYLTAKEDAWRPSTLRLTRARWRKWELFIGASTVATSVTRESLDRFKRAMLANTHSINQVRAHIDLVCAVYRWGVDRDLLAPTKVTTYRADFGRDAKLKAVKMAEYREEDRDKLLAALDPRDATQWRAWALTVLLAYNGPRQTAARHLEWRDVDLDEGLIHWRGELDKMANDRHQPIPAPVRDAFYVALGWAQRDRYAGRFVFYGARWRTRGVAFTQHTKTQHARAGTDIGARDERPWGYAAYVAALHGAEARAGVPHVQYRGAHGWRRGIAGDVHQRTGSEKAAAEWIGDKSVRIVRDHYLLERADALRKTADMLGTPAPESAPKLIEHTATERNSPTMTGGATGVTP